MIITASHTISMGHRLPSYDGICSSPHGHNVRVIVWVQVKNQAFIDFKRVGSALKEVIEPMDHAMVLFEKDPFGDVLRDMGFRHVLLSLEPTTEVIAAYIFWQMISKIQPLEGTKEAEGRVVRVIVEETANYSAICESIPLFEVRRVQ